MKIQIHPAETIQSNSTLRDVSQALENSPFGMILIVGKKNELKGIITDSDLRKAIIKGHRVDTPANKFMNNNPHSLPEDSPDHVIVDYMNLHNISSLPMLDKHHKIVKVVSYSRESVKPLNTTAVIMAGGRGSRLIPLTDKVPKPMLEVGGRPLIQRLIESLYRSGIRDIILSLGYKADIISEFVSELNLPELSIDTIVETKPLGTAGSLTLLPETIDQPLLVLNADVITNLDLSELIRFHKQRSSTMTVGVTSYQLQIPFGVLEMDDFEVQGVREKPMVDFPIVAGIYVISPEVIALMPKNTYQDLPALIPILLDAGMKVSAFPIWEKWMDIGSHEQYAIAQKEIPEQDNKYLL